MTSEYLHAEFGGAEAATRAVKALLAAGVPSDALELFSRRPVETHPPVLPRRSRMSLGAVLSAIACGTGVTALMYSIQLDYPLVTGGMPIVSGWATGVVTFESTMAGAVAGILGMLFFESGLVRRRGDVPVPELPEEGVVVQVRCSRGTSEAAAVLAECGPRRIDAVRPGRDATGQA